MNWILRKLPFIAAVTAFALAFGWLNNDKQFRREQYPEFSLHNTSNGGCSLAYRYLKDWRARRLGAVELSPEKKLSAGATGGELNRLIDLTTLEPDAVVLRLGPQVVPVEHEEATPAMKGGVPVPPKPRAADPKLPLLTPGEKSWIESGGRMMLALEGIYGPIESHPMITPGEVRKVFPIWPEIKNIEPVRAQMLFGELLNQSQILFSIGSDIFAARFKFEKGDVVVFAAADIFSNEHLANDAHLQMLLSQIGGRPFYFDEYVHHLQAEPGVIELLNRWGFGLAMLMIGALSLGAFWRARSPIGPPEDPFRETRSQAVDFVGSLAPLYNRSLSYEQALALYYRNFLQAVAAQSGLRGEALAAKIRALLAEAGTGEVNEAVLTGRKPLDRAKFERWLRVLNEAYRRLELAHRH